MGPDAYNSENIITLKMFLVLKKNFKEILLKKTKCFMKGGIKI